MAKRESGLTGRYTTTRLLMVTGAGVVLAMAAWLMNAGLVSVITPIVMYIALAEGWTILGGYGGYLNLGMVTFFGIGGLAAGVATNSWHAAVIPAILFGMLASGISGLLVGVVSLNLRGAYFGIFTFVSSFIFMAIADTVSFTNGAGGMMLPAIAVSEDNATRIWFDAFVVVAVVAVALALYIQHSRWGAALVAIREDEPAAEVLGIRTMRVKLLAFLAGAVIAGAVGGIYAFQQQFIYPETIFSDLITLQVVLMAVAGGAGSWIGPIVGTLIVMGLSTLLQIGAGQMAIAPQIDRVIYGFILIAVGLFASDGLVGLIRRGSRHRRQRTPEQLGADRGSTGGPERPPEVGMSADGA